MSTHQIEIIRDRDTFTARCSCRRWMSKPLKRRSDAEDAGDVHVVRGDDHNRALAQFGRGTSRLATELKWYEEQAESTLNTPKERQMWKQLADELRPRVGTKNDPEDVPLFEL